MRHSIKIHKICQAKSCGKSFEVHYYRRFTAYYCSLSCIHKGKISPRKGKKASLETRRKQSLARIGKYKEEKIWNWKGDSVSYRNLHRWIERRLGKANKCSNDSTHFSTRYHWANISGEYKRELTDWRELCPSCNLNDGVKIASRFMEGGAFI